MEQLHAQALAAAVRLQDDRLTGEVALRGGDDMVAPGDQDGARRGDAVAFQRGILAGLADLEVERAGAVDHAPAPAGEPGQHRGGELGREAMVARVRRGTHAVVEHALRRRGGEIEGAGIEEPLGPGQSALVEGLGERRQPGGILVQDMDAAHARNLRSNIDHGGGFFVRRKRSAPWGIFFYHKGTQDEIMARAGAVVDAFHRYVAGSRGRSYKAPTSEERCRSGRSGRSRKPLYPYGVPWVRIPPSPPGCRFPASPRRLRISRTR